jgi:CRISPR-associated protein Csb2
VFTLEVEYLLGRSFAGSFQDRSQSEWPPHPGRLFSALASAFFEEGGADAAERRALEWLEQQPPPAIRAGDPGVVMATIAYVPTNYGGANVPALRERQPRYFPAQAPSEASVHFIWNSDPPVEIVQAIDRMSSRTAYLGKACSMVRMRLVDSAPQANYEPNPTGGEVLRVPSAGRLRELKWLFEANQMVSAGAQQRYARVDGHSRAEISASSFGSMLIYRRAGGPGLPIEAALTLTEAVRKALLSNAGKDGEIAAVLSGHESGPHCAIAALPFVGRPHADGRLMGFAVILPRNVDLDRRRAVMGACADLENNGLHISNLIKWKIEAMDADNPYQNLRPHTWIRPSRVWRTVTPILLDRFPKKKGPSVEQILRTACIRVGLPEPASIEHSPFSNVEGVPPVPAFRLHRTGEERPRWGVHATLSFDVPVRGPVLLGAGRFFGLGLMRPVLEEPDGRS